VLLFAVALLFLLVFAHAYLQMAGAPQRERMIEDAATTAGALTLAVANRLGGPLVEDSTQTNEITGLFARSAATAARWVLFFASRGAITGLLGVAASSVAGLLAVYVAFLQVRLLEHQSTIMDMQTDIMAAENNARTLEYHLDSIVRDVRVSKPIEKAMLESESRGESYVPPPQYVSPMILAQRVNVVSRAMDVIGTKRPEGSFALSRERGVLLATLIAEGFDFANAGGRLSLPSSDLTAIPPYPVNGSLSLGKIDLSQSYAAATELHGYDLTAAQLTGAVLPPSRNLSRSVLRNPRPSLANFRAEHMRLDAADLSGAEVPTEDWLRELEGSTGTEGFGATPWVVNPIAGAGHTRFIVRAHPDPDLRLAEASLSFAATSARYRCAELGQSCTAAIDTFCRVFARLIEHPLLNARGRGSLFSFGVVAARLRIDLFYERPTADDARTVSIVSALEAMERCVVSTTFTGRSEIDISLLSIAAIDYRGADLSRVRWKSTSVSGQFDKAKLPAADNFADAESVVPSEGPGYDEAEVPTADWEYRVCMNRAKTHVVLEFFPFSALAVVRERDRFVLRPSRCAGPSMADDSEAERKRYCESCAAVAN
jgi:hypothetical protein